MLERMYPRYCEKRDFGVAILEQSDDEVAGIKGATLKMTGDYACGPQPMRLSNARAALRFGVSNPSVNRA